MSRRAAQILRYALPLSILFWLCNKAAQAWLLTDGAEIGERILDLPDGVSAAFVSLSPCLEPTALLFDMAGAAVFGLTLYSKVKNAKKLRPGTEYGSACWGTAKDIKPFLNRDFSRNIILTATERLTLGRIADPERRNVNHNVLVIGGSGSGKTRYHVLPNIMQLNASYLITDPKGTLIEACGSLLERGKYQIKILNVIDFSCSMHYNPFHYVHTELDVLRLVTVLMQNTKGEGSAGDPFWEKAEQLLYQAYISYIIAKLPKEEQNFTSLLDMINASATSEEDESYENQIDHLFAGLAEENPEHFAVRQYQKYKLAAAKTAKSILISCATRLAPFDIPEVRAMMEYDEMELDMMGSQKTALFAIVSDTDKTFHFIPAMLYSQMFNVLCDKALDSGGSLPIHVTCLLDEFANQTIPNFEHLISVIRSRNISAHIILQTKSQLKAVYKNHAETISGCCSTQLFLGGKEYSTLKEISEELGRETIDSSSTGESRGRETSHSTNYQKLGKALMTADELAVMPSSQCILQLQGVRPFYSRKYDITKHPNYKYLAEADPKNSFDARAYVKRQLKLRPEMVCRVIEVEDEDTENMEESTADK